MKIEKLEEKDEDRFNQLVSEMVTCVKSLGDYVPAFDDPLIKTIARCIIYIEKAEEYLDRANGIDVVSSATDVIVKRTAVMRQAVEDLAANRRARLKQKSSEEVKSEIEQFIREIMGNKKS